ncbi:MAG: phosphatase PAP2 family protein [Lachnospiraceae bacterium]
MNRQKYVERIGYIKSRPLLFNIVKACYYVIPYIIGALYVGIIAFDCYRCVNGSEGFGNAVVIISGPALAFVIVSVYRKLVNAKRPYEVYEYEPLIAKNKAGESFPSRHAASAFAIATACMVSSAWVGLPVFILATIVALSRFFAGVHFAKDVVAGAIAGTGIVGAVWLFISVILS